LLVISAIFQCPDGNKEAIPIAWCYMADKNKDTYVNVYTVFRQLLFSENDNISYIHLVSDDENSLYTSFFEVFSDAAIVDVSLCEFHFITSFTRWLRNKDNRAYLLNKKGKKFDELEPEVIDEFDKHMKILSKLIILPATVIPAMLS